MADGGMSQRALVLAGGSGALVPPSNVVDVGMFPEPDDEEWLRRAFLALCVAVAVCALAMAKALGGRR